MAKLFEHLWSLLKRSKLRNQLLEENMYFARDKKDWVIRGNVWRMYTGNTGACSDAMSSDVLGLIFDKVKGATRWETWT